MKPLASTNILNALLPPIALLVALTIFVFTSGELNTVSLHIIIFLFYAILIGWTYAAAVRTYDLYYDAQFIYLKGLKVNLKIPLSAIKRIQFTYNNGKENFWCVILEICHRI
jgi:hypothetical protein